MYADGTAVNSADFGNTVTPNVAHSHSYNLYYHRIYEFSDQTNMKRRHPSSKCYVRAWGNKTTEILDPVELWIGSGTKTNVVCQGIVRTKYTPIFGSGSCTSELQLKVNCSPKATGRIKSRLARTLQK